MTKVLMLRWVIVLLSFGLTGYLPRRCSGVFRCLMDRCLLLAPGFDDLVPLVLMDWVRITRVCLMTWLCRVTSRLWYCNMDRLR